MLNQKNEMLWVFFSMIWKTSKTIKEFESITFKNIIFQNIIQFAHAWAYTNQRGEKRKWEIRRKPFHNLGVYIRSSVLLSIVFTEIHSDYPNLKEKFHIASMRADTILFPECTSHLFIYELQLCDLWCCLSTA